MAKKRKLIVIPQAGLGNRMRVLSSCIRLAIKDNRKLYIAWPINEALGCDMTDIFESIGIDYSVPPRWIQYLLTKIYRPGAINKYYTLFKLISKIFSDKSIFDDDIIDYKTNKLKKIAFNSNDATILVASCLAFGNYNEQSSYDEYLKDEESRLFFKFFKFNDHIERKVNKEYHRIGEPFIGIHIRRTDHVDLIKQNPIENYLKQIDKAISENKVQKFFLATDDINIKNTFINKYGNRIYTFNSKLNRNNVEGIHGAVIELILLSLSSKIICSIISSYSNAAVLIGAPKEVLYIEASLFKDMQDKT
ncbi:O-fucosyltransferase family protein [Spirosoma flavum]|uniref:Alpha-(1,6)-fucosyltransferase N- and catalytic domain-containing protein n=1 Tax=Spirosoma flavum TaxID=2048557 RepID=A0ABW6ANW3_9BACT